MDEAKRNRPKLKSVRFLAGLMGCTDAATGAPVLPEPVGQAFQPDQSLDSTPEPKAPE